MYRWQRRLWIAGLGLGTSLLILVGLLVGAFRIAVQLVPDYRADVESRVAELLQAPARIDEMNLIWRGRYPTLQLHGVALGPVEQGLYFRELRIGFSLLRLLQGDLRPRRIRMRGTDLQLQFTDGQLRLRGLNRQGTARQAPDELLDQLYDIGWIELTNARLVWLDTDHHRPARELKLDSLVARRRFGGMDLRASGRLRGQGDIELELQLQRDPWQLDHARIHAENLEIWQDLHAFWPELPALAGDMQSMTLDSRWQDGQWQAADLDFDLRDVGPADSGQRYSRWRGQLQLSALRPGIRAELHNAELVAPSGRWPQQLMTLQWQPADAGRGKIRLGADYLRLDDLQVWAGLLPDAARQMWQQLSPAGDVRELLLQLDPGQAWPRVTAELDKVQFSARDALPGLRGLSGVLSMDRDSGRLVLDSQDLILDAPKIFAEPLPLDELGGNLSWRRAADGWTLSAPGLHYAAMNLDGVGRLELALGEQPQIDLELNFFCTDPRPWLRYQPVTWGPGLRRWLSQAIRRADVSNGQVLIQGALEDFPFHGDTPGQFRVALELADIGLKFASDWPQVDISRAELLFDGHELSVSAFDNGIGGLTAARADARIADLRESVLSVESELKGDAKAIWRMLGKSKLRPRIGAVLDDLDLSGNTSAELQLSLPLKDLDALDYQVRARFDRAALWTRYWPDPVQKIEGEILISREGLRSRELTAAIAGLPVTARLTSEQGLTRLEADLQAGIDELPDSVPVGTWLRSRASGRSNWRFTMAIGRGADPNLRFESNLLGTALDLPRPLGKAEDELRRVNLRIEPGEPVRLALNYARLLGLDALIRPGEGLHAARLHFGNEVLPAGAPGWWVEGQLDRARFDEWLPLIQDLSTEVAAAGGGGGPAFGGMVLRIDELQAVGQRLPDSRLQLTRGDAAWQVTLAGPKANGTIRLPHQQAGQRLRLDAEFAQLNWARQPGIEGTGTDPREVPELHVTVDNFALNDVGLGRLQMDLTPVDRGARIETFRIRAREREEVSLTGLWLRDDAGESAALELAVDTRAIADWLSALGYQDNITAKRGRIDARLNWAPDPQGLSYAQLNGELDFRFSDGQLLNVEPGAGRVLGLFSINALPRRFFLDFSDVVNTGLGFDKMGGKFTINDGVAATDDFELQGPSLRIAARGTVDLARRLYDQTITIYPGLSSGVSLAATLLGGPVVGMFTLLAQELLDKPLDQVTQISYHLGGSWDNPEVSRTQ